MILAELEVFHSRPIAPTRRVALGRLQLPVEPAPGPGGLLLGAVAARFVGDIEPDLFDDLTRLTFQLEHGYRIPQPRLRHRLQRDRVGLTCSAHRLVRRRGTNDLEFEEMKGAPVQHVLAAVYAAGTFDAARRPSVMTVIRRGLRWGGGADAPRLLRYLAGGDGAGFLADTEDPVLWALDVLGFEAEPEGSGPPRPDVQRRFRALLRDAHPDNGGIAEAAAERIAVLTEARRILLA